MRNEERIHSFLEDRFSEEESEAFTVDVTSDPDDAAITRAIVAMSKSLGLYVVAEGVETAEQERFMREVGCDALQGFRIGAPAPPDDVVAFLRRSE